MKPFSTLKSKIKTGLGRLRALFYVGNRDVSRCSVPSAVAKTTCSFGASHREAVLSIRQLGVYFPRLYQIMSGIGAILRSFVYGTRYIVGVCAVAFAFWAIQADTLGLVAMAIIAGIVMLATRDFLPALLPVVLLGFFIPMQDSPVGDIIMKNLAIFVLIALLVIGAIVYVLSAKRLVLGKHFWPYAAMSLSFILAGIGFSDYNPNTILNLASVMLSFVFYFCARNGIRSVNKYYLVKVFTAIGILVFAEIVWYYLMHEDLAYAISAKTLHLRWAISNAAAAVIMITIPITLYGYILTKKLGYLGALLIEYVGVVISLSRGCMLIAIVCIPIVMALIFMYSDRKKRLAVLGIAAVVLLALLMLIVEEIVSSTLARLTSLGFSDSGRLNIYKLAVQDFITNPIFGVGVRNPRDPYGRIYWYHSTPLQFLACGGLIGIASYAFHLFSLGKRLKKRLLNPFNLCVAFAMVHWGLYGFMDNNFFMSVQAFLFAALIIVHEKNAERESVSNQSMALKAPHQKVSARQSKK